MQPTESELNSLPSRGNRWFAAATGAIAIVGLALPLQSVAARPLPFSAETNLAAVVTQSGADSAVAVGASNHNRTRRSAPMALPRNVVSLYHMMWSNSGSPLLRNIPAGVNVVNLAFLQGDPPRIVGWGSQGEASFIADAKALRARGVRIVASVGGAHGQVNIANRTAFVDGVMALNAKLPLDGLDWDLEGTAMGTADVVWISRRLKDLRGENFSITMAPNGSNIDQYRAIAVRLQKVGALDLIGQQFYDAVVSKEAAKGRVDQLIGAGIPQSRISIGMMVGPESTYWTVDESVTAVSYIKQAYPNLRGGYLWEHGRARTAGWVTRVGALLRK